MNERSDYVDIQHNPDSKEALQVPTFEDIILEVRELRDLLQKETALLRAMDVEGVKRLHDRKLQLIRRIEIHKELVRKHHQLLGSKTQDNVEMFARIAAEIDTVIAENHREVMMAKEVNYRVIQVISQAANRHQKRAAGYDRYGMDVAAQPRPDGTGAITIRETI